MAITMGPQGVRRPGAYGPAGPQRRDPGTFLARWLRVWVVLLVVVTVVVVVYLILITNTLASINGNLLVANRGVQGAGGNTVTLPSQVDRINASLASIDPALKPVPDQANQIIAALSAINGSLTATDSSLKDTSSALTSVLGGVGSIRDVLIQANDPPDRLGVQNIHELVAAINGVSSPGVGSATAGGGCAQFCTGLNLTTAEADAANILADLHTVNGHLSSACNSLAASLLEGGRC